MLYIGDSPGMLVSTRRMLPSVLPAISIADMHGFGVHVESLPRYLPLADVHSAAVMTWQLSSGKQQAPVGCGHGFGVHVVSSP
jgi:hypothetical protein